MKNERENKNEPSFTFVILIYSKLHISFINLSYYYYKINIL